MNKKRPDLSFVMSYLWPDPNMEGNIGLANGLLSKWGLEPIKFAMEVAQRPETRIKVLFQILNKNHYITEAELQSGQYPAKIRERELDKKLASQS